jgi:hypothetical protein
MMLDTFLELTSMLIVLFLHCCGFDDAPPSQSSKISNYCHGLSTDGTRQPACCSKATTFIGVKRRTSRHDTHKGQTTKDIFIANGLIFNVYYAYALEVS